MSAILNFDFQKIKTVAFFKRKFIQTTRKRHNFTRDNYIFPKQRRTWASSRPITLPLRSPKPEDPGKTCGSKIDWKPNAQMGLGIEPRPGGA